MQVLTRPPSGMPALVLNADFRPLSYYPLSIWPWQEVIKAVFLDRVGICTRSDKLLNQRPTLRCHPESENRDRGGALEKLKYA